MLTFSAIKFLLYLNSYIVYLQFLLLFLLLNTVNSYDHSVQAIVWFLARWSATYLMPPAENKGNASSDNHKGKHHKKVLLDFCEVDNQGKAVLDIIINIAMTIFISYPGEKDLQVCKVEQPFLIV